MFQISSGCFFEENKIEKHEGTFVFYSNVDINYLLESDLPEFKVKKIDGGGINCYLVDYVLLTEKPDKIEAGVVIRAGDQDYMEQFIQLWEFYFDCVARPEKETVKQICAQLNFRKNRTKIALEIAPYLVEIDRRISHETAMGFSRFVNDVVGIDRASYKSVISALKIISDTKESLSTNFDLTYSMLVYALESLSQRGDGYESTWQDYDQTIRSKLDEIFLDLSPSVSDEIKSALIDGKQFKLLKRFKSFIINNLNDEFFYESNRFPIRRSFLEKALDNLYKMRSSFVHELKPLDVMISQTHNPVADCLIRFGEPYFTYSGLLRLLRHLILHYCKNNQSQGEEKVNWVMETSSILIGEMSPEYWMWNPDSFTARSVSKWFVEYLEMLNKNQVVDLSRIMKKIENIFDGSQKQYKSGLISFYYLYNLIHSKNDTDWIAFASKRDSFIKVDMYWYASCAYLYNSFNNQANITINKNDLKDFSICYEIYNSKKFQKNVINLPAMTEAFLLILAANSYFKSGMYENYKFKVKLALSEISHNVKVFSYVKGRLENSQLVEVAECFRLYRE